MSPAGPARCCRPPIAGARAARPCCPGRGNGEDAGCVYLPAGEGEGQRSTELPAADTGPSRVRDAEQDKPSLSGAVCAGLVVAEPGFSQQELRGRFCSGLQHSGEPDGHVEPGLPDQALAGEETGDSGDGQGCQQQRRCGCLDVPGVNDRRCGRGYRRCGHSPIVEQSLHPRWWPSTRRATPQDRTARPCRPATRRA